MDDGSGATGVKWGLADHQGSIRDIVNSTGALIEHRDYTAYGAMSRFNPDGTPDTSAFDFVFAFTGREWDEDVNLANHRARWYDPNAARFINQDPSGFAGGDANLYRYAANNPVIFVDPSGLCYHGFAGSGASTGSGGTSTLGAMGRALWSGVSSLASNSWHVPSVSTARPQAVHATQNLLLGGGVEVTPQGRPIFDEFAPGAYSQSGPLGVAHEVWTYNTWGILPDTETRFLSEETMTRLEGVGQLVGGIGELGTAWLIGSASIGFAGSTGGLGTPIAAAGLGLAGVVGAHGVDNAWAGMRQIWSAQDSTTYTEQAFMNHMGSTPYEANAYNNGLMVLADVPAMYKGGVKLVGQIGDWLSTGLRNVDEGVQYVDDVVRHVPQKGLLNTELSKNARRYLRDIEQQTGLAVHPSQRAELAAHLRTHSHTRLTTEAGEAHRRLFSVTKDDVIAIWEKNTGQAWPRYTQQVVSQRTGKVLRKAGDPFDAHHIIENIYEGPHTWWNIHPARFPGAHQGGIHRAGGVVRKIVP